MEDTRRDLFEEGRQGLWYALSDAPESSIRRYAAFLLGQRGDPGDIPVLVRALADSDKQVRNQSVLSLVIFGEEAVAPLAGADFSGSFVARYRVAEALGLIGRSSAVPRLVVLASDENDHVRYMAAKSLGLIGDEQGSGAIEPLLHDKNEYVRHAATNALSRIHKKSDS